MFRLLYDYGIYSCNNRLNLFLPGCLSEEEIGAMIKSAKKLDKIGQIQQARKGKGNVRQIMGGPSTSSPVMQQIEAPENIYNDPEG